MKINLNLIPEYKREEVKRNKRLRLAIKGGILLLFLFLFLFGGLSSFDYISGINLKMVSGAAQSESKKESFEKVKQMEGEFGKINDFISQTEKIQREQLYWSQILLKLNPLVPGEILISDLVTKDYKILMAGTAKSRDALLQFKDNLEKEECFSAVALPLSDLVTKDDIDFQIEFNVNKSCLKKQ
jgi:Tfp pilus assembly protein PilN